MTSKQKKGLRSSIDDVLGDLLGDEEDDRGPVQMRPASSSSSAAAVSLPSRRGKRSLLDDDFFSKLAEEAEEDEEGSDVSEADPAVLLDSMKDMDDMDADLFGSRQKKPSSAPPQRNTEEPKPGGRTRSSGAEEMLPEEKKPSSAPASTTRTYKTFSFLDKADDPLDDLLDELEEKKKPSSSSSSAAPLKTHTAAVKKREDLKFDEDGEDLMVALGFGEIGNGSPQKKESDRPPRARTRLDEILARGTSPRLLERPGTGEKLPTESRSERPPEKNSPGRAPLRDEEDFSFGSYQPSVATAPVGRQSRRASVRFSTEDGSVASPEHKPKTSARPSRARSDWLGLTQQQEDEEEMKEKQEPEASRSPPAPSPVLQKERPGAKRANSPGAPLSPKPAKSSSEEEADWLTGALNRRKTQAISQSEEREHKQEVMSAGQEEEVALSLRSTVSADPRRRQEEALKLSTESISMQALSSADSPHKPVLRQSPAEGAVVPVTQTLAPPAADSLQQFLLQQQLSQAPLWGLSRSLDASKPCDVGTLQKRIVELEAQVRSLELEREQNQTLLESLQLRQKQDAELMENMHRAHVKLLQDSFTQRELRLKQENEELVERLETHARLAERERAELQETHACRLTNTREERESELQRLRELQRKSILEMKSDHEQQIQRLKKLKEEEIDAVTSASSQTRSLSVIIEQMEQFSLRLGDLSTRVETSHSHSASQTDQRLRDLQERLSQQQREMSEERSRLKEVISRMDTQLTQQQRELEKERWRVASEQAKVESSLRGLEEERRSVMQQLSMEREELDRAKSALLEEQQSVMQRSAEERRSLASEWSRLHAQEKRGQDRSQREAQEQADRRLQASELKQQQEALQRERDGLERDRQQLERDRQELEKQKESLSCTALKLKTRANEVEAFSQLASERLEEGERALREARALEAEQQSRLRSIHTHTERLRRQEHSLQQERLRVTHHHRDLERQTHTLPISPAAPVTQTHATELPPVTSRTPLNAAVSPLPVELHARLALIKHTAQKDQDFLQEEQYFLETLKKTSYSSFTT